MTASPHYQQRITKFINEVTVYPVSCERLTNGRTDYQWLDGVLAGGARIVQLRDKESDDLTLFQKAKVFRQKTREAGALFILNDRLDIALLVEADGIHLGNNDIPCQEARRICPDLIIGVSANTAEQAADAKDRGASYFNIGPLYATQTKDGLTDFLGAKAVSRFSAGSDLPFTVMGGIKLENVPALCELNVQRITVVTALTQAEDIARQTRLWIESINNGRSRQ